MATDSRRCRELGQNANEARAFLKQAVREEELNKQEVRKLEEFISQSQGKLINLEQGLSIILASAVDLLRSLMKSKRRLPFPKPESAPEAIAQFKLIADEKAQLKEAKQLLAYRRDQLAQKRRDIPYFQGALKKNADVQRRNGC
ncbi:hypothetical protein [Martelella endophytica]|nr:hypothetical protein [Martelella endophytica]